VTALGVAAALDDLALAQDDDLVDLIEPFHVMGDEQRCPPGRRPCPPQQAASTLAHKAMLAARFGRVITRHV
jgi:hypothetical protein